MFHIDVILVCFAPCLPKIEKGEKGERGKEVGKNKEMKKKREERQFRRNNHKYELIVLWMGSVCYDVKRLLPNLHFQMTQGAFNKTGNFSGDVRALNKIGNFFGDAKSLEKKWQLFLVTQRALNKTGNFFW